MREIDDHKKTDLEKVACSNLQCLERGDRTRCYIEIGEGRYELCVFYKTSGERNGKR